MAKEIDQLLEEYEIAVDHITEQKIINAILMYGHIRYNAGYESIKKQMESIIKERDELKEHCRSIEGQLNVAKSAAWR